MAGKTDLNELIATMAPVLDEQEYVFAVVDATALKQIESAWATIVEAEGVTVVLRREQAEALGLARSAPYRRITLTVHSSLEAVGLTAHVAGALAAAGVPCNVIAGFHHDHLLVPTSRAKDAMLALARSR